MAEKHISTSLQGAIQLKKSNKRATNDLKKIPDGKNVVTSFTINYLSLCPGAAVMSGKNYFLALRWMISAGRHQDDGLKGRSIKEALQQKKKISDTRALAAAAIIG
ncbi:MAG: hypothetical protein IPF93_14280 [Saprospiraceae bacterium]|nr:hypothetical protein [Saprospiraceae bacterium]